jgi:hypothetical protein
MILGSYDDFVVFLSFPGSNNNGWFIMIRRGQYGQDVAKFLPDYGYNTYPVEMPMTAGEEFWTGISALVRSS